MITHSIFTRTLSTWSTKSFRVLFALIFALSLIGIQPARPVAADYLASCSGCAITTSGSNVIYTFNGSGTFTPSVGLSVSVLVVAGGGGGGGRASNTASTFTAGGGGGAGGLIAQNGVALTTTAYTVTVGAGGSAGTGSAEGGNGVASSIAGSGFTTITATGGGGGGTAVSSHTNGLSGGSGGGGGRGNSTSGTAGTGTTGQGNAGAAAAASPNRGGGGGGASAAGSNQNGGNGTASSITGTSVTYAGGGGGGAATAGTGGNGGGGAGNSSGAGTAGVANTGGGGGGAGFGGTNSSAYNGGAGGSGIVVISYSGGTPTPNITTTGTLSAFNSALGTSSAEQSYTVSGANLTDNLVVTAPTDFQVSTTSGSYSSNSLSLTPSGGTVTSTTIFVRLNPSTQTNYSGNITNASTGATTANIVVSGSSVPVITTTSSMTAFSAGIGVYSAEKSYTVSGINLTGDIAIVPPADFEVSKTSGGAFVDSTGSLTVSQTGGVVPTATIYARFKRSTAGTSTGSITHDSNGATQQLVTVNGTANPPGLTTTGTLTLFSSTAGAASSPQSFTVSGSYLADNVTVTAPADFQVSTSSGSGYSPTVTLNPTNGTLASTQVYVVLNRLTAGDSSGNISVASSGATTQNVAASGTAFTWVAYNDASYVGGDPSTNITQFSIYTSTSGTLIKRADGSNTTVNATFSLSSPSVQNTDFQVTTSGGEISGTDAYNTFHGSVSTAGVVNGITSGWWIDLTLSGLDPAKTYTFVGTTLRNSSSYTTRNSTYILSGDDAASNASSSGVTVIDSHTIAFNTGYNSQGNVVRWKSINPGSDGTIVIRARASTTAEISGSIANSYGLSVFMLAEEYSAPTPTISTSGTLTAFNSAVGTPSGQQSYTVAGSNLTNNIVITPPTDFEISLAGGGGFSPTSPITLTQSGGTVATTTIYVRLNPTTATTYSANIANSSIDATTRNVAVSGSSVPTITTTGTLSAFSSTAGAPSAEQSYTVSAVNLTANLVIAAPADFEISTTSGSGFGGSLSLIPASGSVGTTTIFVRFNRSTAGGSSGVITHDSTNATQRTVAVSGTAAAPLVAWTAYNDASWQTPQPSTNITQYSYTGTTSGLLKDYSTGTNTVVTATFTSNGTIQTTNNGNEAASGTDAYNTFNGKVSTIGVINGTASGWWIDVTFTGLDSAKTYTFATTTVRNSYSDRNSLYTISGVDAATNASTSGVHVVSNESVWFNTGMNQAEGYVARWVGIQPGSDGSFKVRAEPQGTSINGYGQSVFMLHEEIPPSITTSGTLTSFSSTRNAASAEQSYTVSGTNLISDITVTAPTGFQVSKTSGSGFASSVSVTPVSGTVTDVPIYVRFLPSAGGVFSGNITNASNGATTQNVLASGTATANEAPAVALVQPAQHAPDIVTPPTLGVTVTDPNSDTSNVSFYGRPIGGAGEDFRLIVFPDTQHEAGSLPAAFYSQGQYIANNKDALNIAFVTHVGDIVDIAGDAQYSVADTAFGYLDTAHVGYSVGPGNHDDSTYYNTYFGPSRFTGNGYYQGHYGSGNENNYSFFSADGMDFILINLQDLPTSAQLDWADALLKANPSRRAIVSTHRIIDYNNNWLDEDVYTALKDNPNLFLMLCGHSYTGSDGAAYRAELGDDGHTIYIVMQDYQAIGNGNGYLRIYRFSPANDKIYMTTYSPYTSGSIATSPDQMELAYDMTVSEPFTLIGTVNGVTSGSNASIEWTGAANNSEYEWYAVANDGTADTTSSTWDFTTAAPADNAPTDIDLSNNSVDENSAANTVIGSLSSTDPDEGDTFTYTLVSGSGDTGNASFNILGNDLRTSAPFDYETKASYSVRIRTTDQLGKYFEKAFTIDVTDLNEAPTDISLTKSSVAENSDINTVVGTLSSTDPDTGNTFTYTLVSGSGSDDNASFNILGSDLRTSASFNYESKNSYSIRIRSTDQGSLPYDKIFTITVTDVNEAPTNLNLSNSSVAENAAVNSPVGTLSTSDPDTGDTFSYTLVAGEGDSDNASFNISGSSLRSSVVFDYETQHIFSVRIRTTDQGSLPYEKIFTITVTNLNEAPTDISLSNSSVDENAGINAVVGTLSSTDPDAGNTFTYALVSGLGSDDNSSFNLSNNSLRTSTDFDYETKHSYSIRIRTTDQGSLIYEEEFIITVTDVNEAPSEINLSNSSVEENAPAGTVVGTLSSTDPDAGNTLTYALVSGTGSDDNGSFDISGSSLRTSDVFNYEARSSYSVRIRTTDQGLLHYEKAFTITVTDVNEAPTDISLSPNAVAENSDIDTVVGTLSSSDPDTGNTFTYTLVSGSGDTDNVSFNILVDALRTSAVFDHETKNIYSVRIRTTDQLGLSVEKALNIYVSNVNEPPLAVDDEASTEEDTDLVISTAALTVNDKDVDSYSLSVTAVSNPLHGTVNLDSGSAEITFTPAQDFNGTAGFDYTVSDGSLTDTGHVTVTVTPVNDAPVAVDDAANTPEDTPLLISAASLKSNDTDVDNTNAELSVIAVSNPVNGTVGLVSGTITFTPDPDFNGTAGFDYTVSDGSLTDIGHVTVTVTPVNDAPVFTESDPQAVTMSINGTPTPFSLTLDATDVDGDSLTWSISSLALHGSAGASGTGLSKAITYTPTTDYAGGDSFVVQVADGHGGTDTITVNVTISAFTYNISLQSGWNLVSFNLHPTSTTITDVLAPIAGKYSLVYAWNASTGLWMKYNPTAGYGNTLATLDEKTGFWIKMNSAETLTVSGSLPGTSSIGLKAGWNLVGLPASASKALPDALSSHGVDIAFQVYAYHANDPSDPWKMYDTTVPGYVNDLSAMASGWGYWIKVSVDKTWSVGY